jgi:hypothetical protein
MTVIDFEKIKEVERHSKAAGPIIELLNERRAAANFGEKVFNDTVCRVQKISQELFDLIKDGLL